MNFTPNGSSFFTPLAGEAVTPFFLATVTPRAGASVTPFFVATPASCPGATVTAALLFADRTLSRYAFCLQALLAHFVSVRFDQKLLPSSITLLPHPHAHNFFGSSYMAFPFFCVTFLRPQIRNADLWIFKP